MTDRLTEIREANWRSKIQRGMCPAYEFLPLEGRRVCYLDGQSECLHANHPEDCDAYLIHVKPRIERELYAHQIQMRTELAHISERRCGE